MSYATKCFNTRFLGYLCIVCKRSEIRILDIKDDMDLNNDISKYTV